MLVLEDDAALPTVFRDGSRHTNALAIANAHLDPTHLGALVQAQRLATGNDAARVICPDLTRKPWAERLTEEFRSAIRAGATTFEQAGGPRAYVGWPADATAAEGAATIAALGGILADAVRAALQPERKT